VVSKLKKDNIEMITVCFDEYYFIIPESVIKPVPTNAGVFDMIAPFNEVVEAKEGYPVELYHKNESK
jgi:hypothetical protein